MPTIVFGSSKGGAGKTTACVLLACEFARQGQAKNIGVSLIDADPNQHSAAWAKLPGKPESITLFRNVDEDDILDVIDQASAQNPFVLVDLEGVASSAVIGAVSRADLVVIPCQPSQSDAKEAVKTIKMIKQTARIAGRAIPFAVLFTRLHAAIVTKTGQALATEFRKGGIDVFKCSLIDREPFRSIFSFGGTVNNLETRNRSAKQSALKAINNVQRYTEEVKQILAQSQAKKQSP